MCLNGWARSGEWLRPLVIEVQFGPVTPFLSTYFTGLWIHGVIQRRSVYDLELLYKTWNINLINTYINVHRQVSHDIFLVLRKDQTVSYLLFMPFFDILCILGNLLVVSSLQSKYFCWCCRWLGLFPKRNVVVLCQLYGGKMLAAWKKIVQS